jgi:hypothetical protein
MITLQCTKKLATELEIPVSNEKLVTSDAIYCWHAHLFLFNRRKCVMVMNNESRYNFVMCGLMKKDFKRINEHLPFINKEKGSGFFGARIKSNCRGGSKQQ